jgi:hypothetical protein
VQHIEASLRAISPSTKIRGGVRAHEARHISLWGCMSSQQIPLAIQRKSCNILETLSNLLYLTEMEADDPQKVRAYLSLSKETVEAMNQLLSGKGEGEKQPPSFGSGSLRS